MKKGFFLLFLLVLAPLTIHADQPSCLEYQTYLHQVAEVYPDPELGPEGWYRDLVIKGNFAYSVVQYYSSANALQIFDLSESQNPEYRGRVELPSTWAAQHLAIWDHYVYIGGDDLKTADVDDQDAPVVLDTSNAAGDVRDLVVKPGWLFAACGNGQVKVFSLANPAHPQLAAAINAPFAPHALAILGDRLFVGGSGGLAIYSVAFPSFPSLVSTLPLAGSVAALDLQDDLLAAAGGDATRLIDVADPFAPQLLGEVAIGTGVSVVLQDGIAWIGTSGSGHGHLERWDVDDPSTPVFLGRHRCVGIPYGLVLALDHVYTANFADDYAWVYQAPLGIYAGDNPMTPPHLGQLGITPGYNAHYASDLLGDILYVVEETQLDVVDLSDPGDPQLGDSINLMGYGVFGYRGAVVVGPNLLVYKWDLYNNNYWWELFALDDPQHPVYVTTPSLHGRLAARGDHLYESGSQGTLVHESLPGGQLQQVGTLFPGVPSGRPVFDGDRAAYMYGSKEMILVEMDGPLQATEQGRVPSSESGGWRLPLELAGSVLVSLDYDAGVWEVWDVLDSENPQLVFTHPASYFMDPKRCRIRDGILYLDGDNALGVWDLTDPHQPEKLGDWPHVSHRVQVHARPDYLLTQGENGYITTHPYQCADLSAAPGPTDPEAGLGLQAHVSPNPTTGITRIAFTLTEAGPVELQIHDLRGRRVARIQDNWLEAGPRQLLWDGRDEAGRTAAAGVYLVRVLAGRHSASERVVLLR